MTDEKLEKAVALKNKINELDSFIDTIIQTDKTSIVFKKPKSKLLLKNNTLYSSEYELDDKEKSMILKVLIEQLEEMKEEYKNI